MANMTRAQKVTHLLKMVNDKARLEHRINLALRSMDQLIPGFKLVPSNGQPGVTKRGPGRPPLTLAGKPRLKPGPKPGSVKKAAMRARPIKKGVGKAKKPTPNVVKDDKKD
jgi:hypothetical protein